MGGVASRLHSLLVSAEGNLALVSKECSVELAGDDAAKALNLELIRATEAAIRARQVAEKYFDLRGIEYRRVAK